MHRRPIGTRERIVCGCAFNEKLRVAIDELQRVALYGRSASCMMRCFGGKTPTAMEQPLAKVLSTSGASSGNAETLIPFANRASVTLKSGTSNSPVWALTPATPQANTGAIVAEILMLHNYEENLVEGTKKQGIGRREAAERRKSKQRCKPFYDLYAGYLPLPREAIGVYRGKMQPRYLGAVQEPFSWIGR